MTRPKLLDLFCGEGGAGYGYDLAGLDVTGVDTRPQPRYPFAFIEADALEVLADLEFVAGFDAIGASPPCQDYSKHLRHMAAGYPRLIEAVRDLLRGSGRPWVIENVEGAPLPVQSDLFGAHGVELCGTMFGLPLWRHRLFETSWPVSAPRGCDHSTRPMNPHFANPRGGRATEKAWRAAMGVGWMTQAGAREAVPPAYTGHIGRALLGHLTSEEAA